MIPAADLKHILAHTAPLWRELAGSRIFITGGTGFFGIWLLEAIAAANDTLGIGLGATVLSRNPARFAGEHPRLAGRAEFEWLEGHVEDFSFPAEPCDYVIHLATPSAAELGAGGTELSLATLFGTQRVLQFAHTGNARRLLLASSGAVYGRQPPDMDRIPETCACAPYPLNAAASYGEVKRMSELMCALTPDVDCIIARGFCFFGPGLPLTDKFAVGSFMRDALAGGPIRIHGDGTPVRSYLYAADLVIWLITLLLRGRPSEPYNVGSDQAVSLAQLAQQVADTIPGTRIDIGRSPTAGAPEAYVPDIRRARDELGLDVLIPLSSGLRRTVDWARQPSPAPR